MFSSSKCRGVTCFKFNILPLQCIRSSLEYYKKSDYKNVEMGILFMLVNCLLCVQWPDSLQIYVVGYKEGPDLQNAKSICVHNILYITIYNIALYFALYIIFLI